MYSSKFVTVRLTVIGPYDGNMTLSVDRLITQTCIYKRILSGTLEHSLRGNSTAHVPVLLSLTSLSLCFIFFIPFFPLYVLCS
jgi:hypothetical protein